MDKITNFLGRFTNPTKRSSKQLSFEEAKRKIDDILEILNKDSIDYLQDNVVEALLEIGSIPQLLIGEQESIPRDKFTEFQAKLLLVADYLGEKKYAELVVTMTKSLHCSLYYATDKRPYALNCINILLDSFRNYTDQCLILARDFGESGGVDALLKLVTYLIDSMNVFEDADQIVARMVYQRSVAILHNCIRVYPDNRIFYRKADAVKVLSDLKITDQTQSSEHANVFLVLIMSYVVDEHESESLAKSEDCVRLLTKLLNEAVQCEGHYAMTRDLGVTRTTAFSALELLDGLNHLAINDANKAEIERQGGLSSIIRMLQADFSEEEKAIATKTLWSLAFLDSVKRSAEVQASVDTLQSLTVSKNQSLREASTYALWEIQDNQRNLHQESPPSGEESIDAHVQTQSGGHVMISYQWDIQKRAICIRDRLIQEGYNVWMDIDNMRGDILDAMADAVERADVILICMTEKYKDSSSCRSEASYATKKKKPVIPLLLEKDYEPDGWLGILLGTKLYYRFCTEEDMVSNMVGLIKEIGDNGRKNADPPTDEIDGPITPEAAPIVTASPSSTGAGMNQNSSKESVTTAIEWSTEQVQSWLHDIGLTDLCSSLDFCDGNHLKEMYEQYRQSPDVFRSEMKADLTLSFRDLLKFTTALGRLLRTPD
ncbi:uncharacterized protein [Amphiura filiformis]|uniref:uncharacterized protein n=1 Tax=Amphiura filiformis TaxID=82378 RepID=UPI003B221A34